MIRSLMKASGLVGKKGSPCRSAWGCLLSVSMKLPLGAHKNDRSVYSMSHQLQRENGYANLAADLLAQAKRAGATEADIIIADGDTFSVQVRLGAVDRLTKAREKQLGLRVFVGKRSASTSTSDFSKESLDQLVTQTCTLA